MSKLEAELAQAQAACCQLRECIGAYREVINYYYRQSPVFEKADKISEGALSSTCGQSLLDELAHAAAGKMRELLWRIDISAIEGSRCPIEEIKPLLFSSTCGQSLLDELKRLREALKQVKHHYENASDKDMETVAFRMAKAAAEALKGQGK